MHTMVRVWDLPTRVFHWALVACFVGSVISGTLGGSAMTWHFRFGYTIFSLLLFRIVWGMVGGRWSRFASFIYSPASIRNYLRGQGRPEHSVGHNPLGAASVFALLFFLAAQVATGLFSDDEIASSGPLSKFVSDATVSLVSGYHSEVGRFVMLALVALHIGAVLFYLWKKRNNLIRPMIDGDKRVAVPVAGSRDDAVTRIAAALLFGLCVVAVLWVVRLGD